MIGDIIEQLEENMIFIGEIDYKITERSDSRVDTYILHNLDGIINNDYVVFFDEGGMMPENSMLQMFLIESIKKIIKNSNEYIIYFKSGELISIELL